MNTLTYDFSTCTNNSLIGLQVRSKLKDCIYTEGFKKAIDNEIIKRNINVKNNFRWDNHKS